MQLCIANYEKDGNRDDESNGNREQIEYVTGSNENTLTSGAQI